jgi:F-type H+-transporting ATPase subunit delta
MPNPRLAHRYAKSVLDLSIEKGELEKVFEDMQWLQAVCKSREFVSMLKSPVITPDKKEKIIEAITAGKISILTKTFILLLIRKHRENFLPEIIHSFISSYKQHKNIYTVKLTTAVPVSEELKEALMNQIRLTSEMQNIELETAVDESLVGGFVLQAGDKLVDASISYDLKAIARQFENNDFIYRIR